jgi:hypothetical protein
MKFRIYADGSVVEEDEFSERDNSLPYYDDYKEYDIPEEIVDHIVGTCVPYII